METYVKWGDLRKVPPLYGDLRKVPLLYGDLRKVPTIDNQFNICR
ncbi:MAG: hypothetical protein RL329_3739 [Bacteroidota bacterium]|jgi:hypothetical protein